MNRRQPVSSALSASGTKRHFNAKWKALGQSLEKCIFLILALWALISYNAKAAGLSPNLLVRNIFYPESRVWLENGTHKLNVDAKGVILKGYDPVAYFTQKQAVKGSPQYQISYQGATYYFSSAADLAIFEKNPSKYVPQYGGFCANGMKNRKVGDIDPTVFFVLKGKLYVCASPAAEKEFRTNPDENIKKADQDWDEQYEWFY